MEHYLKKELYDLLKNDERIFDFLQEGSLDGLSYWDLEKPENEWMNSRFWKVLGYDPMLMPHKTSSWHQIINQDDLKRALDNFYKHVADPQHAYDQVVRYKHKTGSIVWIRCKGFAIRNQDGKAFRMLGVHQDITALKELEIQLNAEKEALKNCEDLYRFITENTSDVIRYQSSNGRFNYISPNIEELSGFTVDEYLKFGSYGNVFPKDIPKLKAVLNKFEKGIKNVTEEYRIYNKQGDVIWVQARMKARLDDNGKLLSILSSSNNISGKKKSERKHELFSKLLDHALNAFNIVDGKGEFIYVNQAYIDLWGYKDEHEIIGNPFKDHFKNVELPWNIIKECNEKGKFIGEIQAKRKDGSLFDAFVYARLDYDEDENEIYPTTSLDITEQNSIQNKLKESEARYKLISDMSSDYSYCYGFDENQQEKVKWVFGAFEEIIGYSSYKFNTIKDIFKIIHPDDRQLVKKRIRRLLTGESLDSVFRLITKKGEVKWIRETGIPDWNKDKTKVIGVICTAHDITRQKFAEIAYKKQRDLFELVVDSIPIRIFWKDVNSTYLGCNLNFALEAGMDNPKAVVGKTDYDLVWKKDAQKFIDDDKLIMKTGISKFKIEEEFINKSGEKVIWRTNKIALKDSDNQIIGIISTAENITDEKKFANRLKVSEERLSVAIEGADIGIWEWDIITGVVYTSENWIMAQGFEKDEVVHQIDWWINLIHPEDLPQLKIKMQDHLKGSSNMYETEMRVQNKRGEWAWIQDKAKVIKWDDFGKPLVVSGIHMDITERKLYEYKILEQNELFEALNNELMHSNKELIEAKNNAEEAMARYQSLFAKSPSVMLLTNPVDGKIIDANQAACQYYKYTYDEITNLTIFQLNVNPNSLDIELIKTLQEKETNHFVFKHKLADASIRDVELYAAMVPFAGKSFVFSIIHDITDRKESELKLVDAKRKAELANDLKTEFLHNMSHEIRTPMNGIIGFASLLNDSETSAEERKYFTSIIKNSSNQLLRIIDDILEISTLETKQLKIQRETIDLNTFIMELFSVYDLKAKERNIPLFIKKGLPNTESRIISDPSKLNKILTNLIDNAFRFTYNGFIEFGYFLKESKISLYVRDTGEGINPENQKKIFERFSQEDRAVSQTHGGLGLGLSIAKENAQLLGGDISLVSKKGEGSTFFLTIPYNPESKIENNTDNRNTYTILIAEDEEVNYLFLETVLFKNRNADFKIIHAINGQEAVDVCLNNPEIDLVLMDIKMPVMNGLDATSKIKEKLPHLPIIAQTAYSSEADKKQAIMQRCDDFISKPIDPEKFTETIFKFLKH